MPAAAPQTLVDNLVVAMRKALPLLPGEIALQVFSAADWRNADNDALGDFPVRRSSARSTTGSGFPYFDKAEKRKCPE